MRRVIMGLMSIGLTLSCVFLAQAPSRAQAKEKKAEVTPFVVYLDKDADNHYTPSGWLGDWGDLAVADSIDNPHEGKSCLKWIYSAKRSQDQGWAGCYWQEPPNNWGDQEGGYNLSKAKNLVFWARGEKGGELITFLMGGILSGKVSQDTDSAKINDVRLTKDWKKYIIDLKGKNLKNIITGFGFIVTEDNNPKGCTFYLDKIGYVK